MVNFIYYKLIAIYKKYGEHFQGKLFSTFIIFYRYQRVFGPVKAMLFTLKNFFKIRTFKNKSKSKAIYNLLNKTIIYTENIPNENEVDNEFLVNNLKKNRFFYSVDIFKNLYLKGRIVGNVTVDYDVYLNNSLEDLKMNDDTENEYAKENNILIDAIENYIDRVIKEFSKKELNDRSKKIIDKLLNFKNYKATDLFDALQRILIINSIQHQTNHHCVGLGRLDKILAPYIDDSMTDEYIIDMIKEFYEMIHKYYIFKSYALMGDTGQIVILSGELEEGYKYKEKRDRLTRLMLKAFSDAKLLDPKPLLRVNENTDSELYDLAFTNLKNFLGSPLIANDNVIVNSLIKDGYENDDAINYVTSACWEPIAANSYEQNNIISINLIEPFDNIREKKIKINSYEELIENYKKELREVVYKNINFVNNIEYASEPLYSLSNMPSRDKKVDVSIGGGKYNNYGLLVVGMSSLLDSMYNIKEYVFENDKYTYEELDNIRYNDFKDNEELRKDLYKKSIRYGKDEDEYINFTNDIIDFIYNETKDYINKFGGHIKFGISSPHYIIDGKKTSASLDGRHKSTPFTVHISSRENNDYVSLLNFASKLHYENRFYNGAVVDFTISPALIQNNTDKFIDMIKVAIKNGIGELQLNALSSDILIKAMNNKNEYRNLVVRVWGFNSYFVELPKEYQYLILERTKRSEGIS